MNIHHEGYLTLIVVAVCMIVLHYILLQYVASKVVFRRTVLLVSIIIYCLVLNFFRNPDRVLTVHPNGIVAPADGKIAEIKWIREGEYFKDNRIKIRIFMSPFNVHINRHPVSGTVCYFKYHPGRHCVAFRPKASLENERTTVVVENNAQVSILFRQIAGKIARRISYYIKEGDTVKQGEEFGFIKLGSCVDIYIPLSASLKVIEGDTVIGGKTILADLNIDN